MSRMDVKQVVPWATVLTVCVTLGLALLAKLERMDGDRAELAVAVERRLVRIETKLDWLLAREQREPLSVRGDEPHSKDSHAHHDRYRRRGSAGRRARSAPLRLPPFGRGSALLVGKKEVNPQ
jgi:hypothetical protein